MMRAHGWSLAQYKMVPRACKCLDLGEYAVEAMSTASYRL